MNSLLNNSALLNNPAFKQDFVVNRSSGGAWNATTGLWENEATEALPASGSVQPAKGTDMELIARATQGGGEVIAAIRIYSKFDFSAGTIGDQGTSPDIVTYNGLNWNVVKINDFTAHGHDKVYGVRFEGQADPIPVPPPIIITVTEAGSTDVNGTYSPAAEVNGFPSWQHDTRPHITIAVSGGNGWEFLWYGSDVFYETQPPATDMPPKDPADWFFVVGAEPSPRLEF